MAKLDNHPGETSNLEKGLDIAIVVGQTNYSIASTQEITRIVSMRGMPLLAPEKHSYEQLKKIVPRPYSPFSEF